MKKFSLLLAVLAFVGLSASASFADSDEFDLIANVPATNTVVWTGTNASALGNPAAGDLEDIVAGYITFDSNDADGFTITFDSEYNGQLMHDSDADLETDDAGGLHKQTTYNVYVYNKAVSGRGTAAPDDTGYAATGGEATPVSLSSNLVLTHDTTVASATIDAEYYLAVNVSEMPTLFAGNYLDTITVTIAGL